MIKYFNRSNVQNVQEICDEFENCHGLVENVNVRHYKFRLIAISTEPDTEDELFELRDTLPVSTSVIGVYGNWYPGVLG